MTAPPRLNRNLIKHNLSNGIWQVRFYKKDGELRSMPCTLEKKLIPEEMRPKNQVLVEGEKVPVESLNTLRVFATDIGEWRSFVIENVISVEQKIED